MKFEIRSWINGGVLFSFETESFKLAVQAAVSKRVSLRCANLRSADLRYVDLFSADLRSADLRSANLRSADLRSANLRSADLRSADLRSANLSYVDLSYADLSYADLSYANLHSADLRSANLSSFISVGPIGSRNDTLFCRKTKEGVLTVATGCFSGTLDEFEKKVEETHGENDHAKAYADAIKFLRARLS
jgi:hypothetical protein